MLKSAAQAEREWLDVVLASDGDSTQHLAFYGRAKLQQFPYVLSADLGMTYRVSRLPYAVLIDERGVIRAKGLINSREHLESLFNAKELGVGIGAGVPARPRRRATWRTVPSRNPEIREGGNEALRRMA